MATAYPIKKMKKERRNSSNSDREEETEVDKYNFETPADFYCQICKVSMNSKLVWDMHVSGKKHQKKKAAASFGKKRKPRFPADAKIQQIKVSGVGPTRFATRPSNEIAQIQIRFDRINDRPVVGLNSVTEIWRKDSGLEPVYHCTICKADCQAVTIVEHVLGSRHLTNYIKHVEKERNINFQFSELDDKKQIIHVVKGLQNTYGKGIVRVENEVSEDEEEDKKNVKLIKRSDEDNQELACTSHHPLIELKIKSIDGKDLKKSFFELENETKRTAIMAKIPEICPKQNPKLLKNQLKEVHHVLLHKKIMALSLEERMKMSREIINKDFTNISTYFNFEEVKKDAKKIVKLMGGPSAEKD